MLIILHYSLGAQENQKPFEGKIDHIENFPSKYIEARNVDIWLPKEYDGKSKFAVLYMHDGQMLFDSNTTWNHQSWEVDDVAAKLQKEGKVTQFIVVGIWNAGKSRHANYFPQKPFEKLSITNKEWVINQLQQAGRAKDSFQPNSDNYLKFIVSELKPFVEKKYQVYSDLQHNFIAGSSMGGLISIYAICEYPQVFGGAACLSTHWPGTFNLNNNPMPDAFINYLNNHLPSPQNHKIYFDCGDQTLDALYPAIQHQVDQVMKQKRYSSSSWESLYFKGKDHSEKSWNERLEQPLLFLFKK